MAGEDESPEMLEVKQLGQIERKTTKPHARHIFVVSLVLMVIIMAVILVEKMLS
jgi:uncharacterized membrane protein YidH (DUF202 family)